MIAMEALQIWLEQEFRKQGDQEAWSQVFNVALSSLGKQINAQGVAECLRVYARNLSKEPENGTTLVEFEKIIGHIENSYRWEIWRESDPPQRIEGPSSKYQEVWIKALTLWNQTRQLHTTVLVGSEPHRYLLEKTMTKESI